VTAAERCAQAAGEPDERQLEKALLVLAGDYVEVPIREQWIPGMSEPQLWAGVSTCPTVWSVDRSAK